MADLDLTEKLGGQPKWVWILGGVAALYAFNVYRNRQAYNTVAPDNTNQEVNGDIYGLQTGSSGGSGLASLNPTGVPGVIGITAPVAGKPTTPAKPAGRGFTNAQVAAAKKAKADTARGFTAADVRAAKAKKAAAK